jgi:hypothetical protein
MLGGCVRQPEAPGEAMQYGGHEWLHIDNPHAPRQQPSVVLSTFLVVGKSSSLRLGVSTVTPEQRLQQNDHHNPHQQQDRLDRVQTAMYLAKAKAATVKPPVRCRGLYTFEPFLAELMEGYGCYSMQAHPPHLSAFTNP